MCERRLSREMRCPALAELPSSRAILPQQRRGMDLESMGGQDGITPARPPLFTWKNPT